MEDNKEIIEAIKEARKVKGLSQFELGERIGVPQSHISKIEQGGVDIKLSSLIQIARALDFEVSLVPKRAIPAVKSVVSGMSRDHTTKALSDIRNAKKTIDQLQSSAHLPNNLFESFERINAALQGLRALNYDSDAFARLQKVLSPLPKITAPFEQADLIKHLNDGANQSSKQLRNLDQMAINLRNLRNELAHNYEQTKLFARPAYSLEDNDD